MRQDNDAGRSKELHNSNPERISLAANDKRKQELSRKIRKAQATVNSLRAIIAQLEGGTTYS